MSVISRQLLNIGRHWYYVLWCLGPVYSHYTSSLLQCVSKSIPSVFYYMFQCIDEIFFLFFWRLCLRHINNAHYLIFLVIAEDIGSTDLHSMATYFHWSDEHLTTAWSYLHNVLNQQWNINGLYSQWQILIFLFLILWLLFRLIWK
jgi:hypothetical protein